MTIYLITKNKIVDTKEYQEEIKLNENKLPFLTKLKKKVKYKKCHF